MVPMPRLPIRPGPPRWNTDQRRALRRLGSAMKSGNREIGRLNRRRTLCIEKILEWSMRRDRRAYIWITKLVSAGFDRADGEAFERMGFAELEAECRHMLGVGPAPGADA